MKLWHGEHMNAAIHPVRQILIQHWFLFVMAVALAIEVLVAPVLLAENARLAEKVILLDLCLFLPWAYFFCYRRNQSTQQLTLRMAGLVCLGILAASWIIPEDLQHIVPSLAPARNITLGIIIFIELVAFAAILKMLFGSHTDSAEIARKSGAPELIVRLMLMEAKFWKAVWSFFRK